MSNLTQDKRNGKEHNQSPGKAYSRSHPVQVRKQTQHLNNNVIDRRIVQCWALAIKKNKTKKNFLMNKTHSLWEEEGKGRVGGELGNICQQ